MCGIAGAWDTTAVTTADTLRAAAESMARALRHRGPDDEGVWCDPDAGIALAQTRLAIRDLSPAGHQPMVSSCGRYVVVYNGEVYSHEEMARDLRRPMRGHSDTEVIVEAISAWGLLPTVERLIGMFAIGVWDRKERTLSLVRDRMGIKPLYWGRAGHHVAFGSELAAIRAGGTIPLSVDPDALATFFRYAYVPSPLSIYRGVAKVSPATIVTIHGDGRIDEHCYWDLERIARATPRVSDEIEYLAGLDDLLADAVSRRLVSDVPLGSLLSGGVDSSLVTALAVQAADTTIRTFTIGFDDPRYDESAAARGVAEHLGTEHHALVATADDVRELVPLIATTYDEPFADSSQLPTMLVSALTRAEVTVALSGDGGDELFSGYSRYRAIEGAWARAQRLPRAVASPAGALITATPPQVIDRIAPLLPARYRKARMGERARILGSSLRSGDLSAMNLSLLGHWPDPAALVPTAREPSPALARLPVDGSLREVRDALRLLDQRGYLPDDILTKVDRASMRVALEVRVPLLDHRVVERSWAYPAERMVVAGRAKHPLRVLLERRVPAALVDRPKAGFSAPIGDWLRGPLRPWASDLLAGADDFVDMGVVRAGWRDLLAGKPMEYPVWAALVYRLWRESVS